MKSIFLALVVFVVGCGQKQPPLELGDNKPIETGIPKPDERDPELEAAIAEARRTLPEFIAELEKAGPESKTIFSVKVGLKGPKDVIEHLWVDDPAYSNGQFTGILERSPVTLTDRKAGDAVVFTKEEVSDWLIVDKDGKEKGGFTINVSMGRLNRLSGPKEEGK